MGQFVGRPEGEQNCYASILAMMQDVVFAGSYTLMCMYSRLLRVYTGIHDDIITNSVI